MAEPAYASDTQFVGLVEAATAAADKEGDWSRQAAQPRERGRSAMQLPMPFRDLPSEQDHIDSRLLQNGAVAQFPTEAGIRKRKRGSHSIGADGEGGEQGSLRSEPPLSSSPDQLLAGVNSAAALFRDGSSSTKKCTRPPLSKLFASLQLPSEDFLRLQSAAKAYMLAEDHPERRDCVGQRGKTDSDRVKLKLWNCVQDFLDREGHGKGFFGAGARKVDAAGAGGSSMTWPDDAQQVIKTCVPLLRRVVTNERQRQYAAESRKSIGERRRENRLDEERGWEDEIYDGVDSLGMKTDLFGDGLILDGTRRNGWFDVHNSSGRLQVVLKRAGFPHDLLVLLVTSVDAHCRLFHGGSGPQCNAACRSRLVKRLVKLPAYQRCLPTGDPNKTVQDIFDIILANLVHIRYWDQEINEDAPASGAAATEPLRRALKGLRPPPRKRSISDVVAKQSTLKEQRIKPPPQLLIHLVRQDRCLLPCLELPSTKCASLQALRSQVQTHYGPRALQEKGLDKLAEVTIKAWLPAGLMTVADDGQWMVALLSTDSAEWMGGQIRVLLDS